MRAAVRTAAISRMNQSKIPARSLSRLDPATEFPQYFVAIPRAHIRWGRACTSAARPMIELIVIQRRVRAEMCGTRASTHTRARGRSVRRTLGLGINSRPTGNIEDVNRRSMRTGMDKRISRTSASIVFLIKSEISRCMSRGGLVPFTPFSRRETDAGLARFMFDPRERVLADLCFALRCLLCEKILE